MHDTGTNYLMPAFSNICCLVESINVKQTTNQKRNFNIIKSDARRYNNRGHSLHNSRQLLILFEAKK